MVFEDNFIEVKPGLLLDPVAKLGLTTSGHKESYGFDDANLNLSYDPELKADRLWMPPTDGVRKVRAMLSTDTAEIEEPIPFSSEKKIQLTHFNFEWGNPSDRGVLRFKVTNSKHSFNLDIRIFKKENTPVASEYPKKILFYMVQSLARMHAIRDTILSERFPELKKIEVCVKADVARSLFGLSEKFYREVEPGWVCVASREVGQ